MDLVRIGGVLLGILLLAILALYALKKLAAVFPQKKMVEKPKPSPENPDKKSEKGEKAKPWEDKFFSAEIGDNWVTFPWILAGILAASSLVLILKGHYVYGLIPLLGFSMFKFVTIEATQPPSFAMLKIWGKVCDGIRHPKRYLILPYFPFYMSFQSINRKYQELTFCFRNIPAKLERSKKTEGQEDTGSKNIPLVGGSFDLEVGLVLEPDHNHPMKYLLSGGESPSETTTHETRTELHDLIRNNLSQSTQEFGLYNSWEDMVLIPRHFVVAQLLKNLSGNPLPGVDEIDTLNINLPQNENDIVRKAVEEDLGEDPNIQIPKWGFRIRQFKIGPILAEQNLRERAREIAEELTIRTREAEESTTFNDMIRDIIDKSRDDQGNPTMSYADARKEARIQKGITTETISRHIVEGLDGPAKALSGLFGKGEGDGA